MSDIINTIKHSKAIVILLILYTAIAIAVVVLDQKSEKSSKSSSTASKEEKEKQSNRTKFTNDLEELYEDVDTYVVENNITTTDCLKISDIYEDDSYYGSVLLTTDEKVYYVWFGEYGNYVNGLKMDGRKIKSTDISNKFNTEYYNSCGIIE